MAHPSLPMEAVPLSAPRQGVASPATRLPLSPHCNPFSAPPFGRQPRCFPPQSVRFLASFAVQVSRGHHALSSLAREDTVYSPIRRHHARQATSAHSVTDSRPMHRIAGSQSVSYTARFTAKGVRPCTRTGLHENRVGLTMPLEIALSPQARKRALPPSTHPKLGVSSKHQRFHRCAL